MEQNNNPYVLKSAGINDSGFQYERLLTAHLLIKCTLAKEIGDFNLVSNAKEHENLDDIVIHILSGKVLKHVIVCQLKHRENKGRMKDFADLKIYEESYEKLKEKYPGIKISIILFTNAPQVQPKDVEVNPITFKNDNIFSIFNTNGDKGKSCTLNKETSQSTFYDNCYLFYNQINAINGHNLILNDFNGCFNKEEIHSIDHYFLKILQKKKDSFKKNEINFILLNILMKPFVLINETTRKSNTNQLLNTFNTFNLSQISENNSEYLINSVVDFIDNKLKVKLDELQWNEKLSDDIVNKVKQMEAIATYAKMIILYKPLTKKDLWLLFWAIGDLPLLLKMDQLNRRQIEFTLQRLSSNLSVVLCDEENHTSNLPINDNIKVFSNLFDLKETNNKLLLEVLEQTKISLYFNPTSLKEILKKDDDLLKCITPDSFIELLCQNINITTIYERLPFYITRKVQTKLYNKDVAQCKGFISIVDSDPSLPNLEEYCAGVTETTFYSKYTAEVTVKLISNKITDKKFCYFRTLGDKFYCYSTNLDHLDGIEHYLTGAVLNETDLLNYRSSCKIIYGPAGIGKTTLLQNLALKSTPENLCIYIHINDLLRNNANEKSFECREALADYLSNICNYSKDNHLRSFVYTFMSKCLEQNRIQLLFDGFDETNANPEIFERLINKLGIPFILCTRSSKIAEIKAVLKTSSMFELKEFNQENQEEFIREKCENPVNRQEIIDKVVKKLSETPTLNIFGIPFLVKLLTEIYEEIKTDVKEWSIINILETFVEKQMKAYERRHIKRTVRNLACSVFFENHLLEQLKINTRHMDEDLEDFRECNRNDAIISNVNVAKEIQFTHRVYAEFLCAQYLCDLFSNAPPKELKNYSEIYELLFAEDLIQIRYFFDLLMCRDLPLHTAILLKDDETIADIIDEDEDEDNIGNRDKLGRTCLHVLMGYGVRYNYPYKVGGLKNIRKLKTYNLFKEDRQFSINTEIFNTICDSSNYYSVEDTKDLFGNLPHIYGFYSRSYTLLNRYEIKFIRLDSIPDINQTIFFVYFIVNHHFENLFYSCLRAKLLRNIKWEMDATERSSIINFFNKYDTIFEHFNMNMINQLILNENYTILHLASAENLYQTVKSILFYDLIPINCVDYNQNTALDYAILSNNQDIINKLKANGGTTHNSSNNNCIIRDSSPVYKAVMDSDLQTLKLLIEDGADLNVQYDGDSVLEIAARYATTEMLHFLIQTFGKVNIDIIKLLCNSLEKNNIANANYLISYEMDFKNTFILFNSRKINIMHLAVAKGDSKTIERLLKKGCSVDVTDYSCDYDSDKKTPIFHSIEGKNNETLNYLVKQGANLNQKARNNYGVMHCAAEFGNSETISVLKDAGGNIEELNLNQETPIYYSIRGRNVETLKVLISRGANLNQKAKNNYSVMHCAAQFGNSETISILKDAGGNIEDLDLDKNTPIYYSIDGNNIDILKFLISCGANLMHKTRNNYSVMHRAAKFGNSKTIRILKDAGGNIEDLDLDENTPIYYSIDGNNIDTLKFLISCGANLKHKTRNNYSVMHRAAKFGNSKTIRILKDAGGNIEELNLNQETPIYYSICANNINTLKSLISCGANLNHKAKNNYGVMHYAAEFGNSETIRILKNAGRNIKDMNSDKQGLIYRSICDNDIKTLTSLISCGANLNHKGKNNYGVMHFAARYGNSETISILKDAGGNIEDLDPNEETPIYNSIDGNNIDTLKFLISCGANLNHKAKNNYGVMHNAAQFGNSETISILKDAGGNIEELNLNQETPIYYSIRGRNVETLKVLISRGANLNQKAKNNYSVMHCAAQFGNSETISILKDAGGNIEELNLNQETPIYYSICANNINTLKSLISCGANLNHKAKNNYGVMHYAAEFGNSETIRILKNAGRNIKDMNSDKQGLIYRSICDNDIKTLTSLISCGANLNHKGKNNYGVMHFAARYGNSETISILKDAGGNIEELDLNQETPIYNSIDGNNIDTLKFLISCGANLNHKAKNNYGVMHCAAQFGNSETISILKDAGGNIEELNLNQETPIYYSIRGRNVETLKVLISRGANLNQKAKNNYSVMHCAAQFGNSETISILKDAGGNIEDLDLDKNTPIYYSIDGNNIDILKFLISCGANLMHKTRNNYSVMHRAAKFGNSKTIRILKDAGGNIEDLDLDENTPIYYSIDGNNIDTLKFLISCGANLKHKTRNNYSVMHRAAKFGNFETISILKDAGGNIEELNLNQETPIYYSICANNINTLKSLISCGANLNHKAKNNYGVMHYAAEFGNSETIRILKNAGRNIKYMNSDKQGLIYRSICDNDIKTLTSLISCGANLNHKGKNNYGVMHFAARYGNSETISILKDTGGNIEELDLNQETPIYNSIDSNNIDTLKFLISCGANLNHKAKNNYGVMHCAAQFGNSETISILKDAGGNIEELDSNEITPIYYSIRGNNIDTLKFLISCGANLKHKTGNNYGVMHCAAEFGNSETISILKDAGGNIEELDLNQETPIYNSIDSNNIDTLKFLISCGANLKHKTRNNYGVMHYAAQFGNSETISILKDAGGNIEELDLNQETPIYFSIHGNNVETLEFLISCGANLNHKASNNRGIIHNAASTRYPYTDVFDVLIKNSCDIEELDDSDRTAIFYAIKNKNCDVTRYLIEKGANLNHKSKDGSILQFAEQIGHSEIIHMLKPTWSNKITWIYKKFKRFFNLNRTN